MTCESVFIERLRERGFRLTPQREMVLSAMHRLEGLSTAEQIHEQVRGVSAAVDISTVYRTLDLLREFGIVACVDAGDGQKRYELLGLHGPHVHLVCQSCGQVIGVSLEDAQPIAGLLAREHGFHADLNELSIPGLCAECAARRS